MSQNGMRVLRRPEDVPVLCSRYVRVRCMDELLTKINKLMSGGCRNLQIVTDFDYTLTRFRKDDGKQVPSSFGMFAMCPSLPDHYREADARLCNFYKPIERDTTLPHHVKLKHMIDWYVAGNALLKNLTFPRKELAEVAEQMKDCFRHGVSEMVEWSAANQVPVLVFSAGLGESVEAALRASDFLRPNVKVVSNYLAMDKDDTIVGIKGKIIHTMNKNETAIEGTEYYELVRDRSNVILMGDSLGDSHMAEGMSHCDVTLKIGLLHDDEDKHLPAYLQHFDLVLVNDPPIDVVVDLLKLVSSPGTYSGSIH